MNKMHPMVASHGFCTAPNLEDSSVQTPMPQRWMQEQSTARKALPHLNANQITSLSAMIAYTAFQSGQSEFRVERSLSDHFHVANAKCLLAEDFDKAIRYLADICPM